MNTKAPKPKNASPWPFIVWAVIAFGGFYIVTKFWPAWLDMFLFGAMLLLLFGGIIWMIWPAIVAAFQGRDEDEK
jgi:hypothetical protein